MDRNEFSKIIARGENTFVDFKIECNAFDTKASNHDEAKAELVKDILAMANNKGPKSILVIGVSDDGKNFRSVTNSKLTDDNLQSLCKEAISPPPKVNLTTLMADAEDKYKCVVIQVGPNVSQPYKLNRDYISPKNAEKQYHFRANEVWIRRGATTGLASPEEIRELLKKNTLIPLFTFTIIIIIIIFLFYTFISPSRVSNREEQAKACALLKMDISMVASDVNSLVSIPNMIPLQKGPLLEFSANEKQLANLPESVANEVYKLQHFLRKAEESRKVAADLLSQQEKSEFRLHALTYVAYMRSAKDQIEIIKKHNF